MSDQACLKIVVTGKVQGVSFRAFTHRTAVELGLTGYVQNLPDGSVEIVAEGTRSALKKLLAQSRCGPPQAKVAYAAANWGAHENRYRKFEVKRRS